MSSPHRLVLPASGYSNAVVAAPGEVVYVAGQVAFDGSGVVVGSTLAEQLGVALDNVVRVLAECGARPEHVVSMTVFTTVIEEYRASLRPLRSVYADRFGAHYPAMALVGVSELVEPAALVEVLATAVVPR